jgi:hypothetical protein
VVSTQALGLVAYIGLNGHLTVSSSHDAQGRPKGSMVPSGYLKLPLVHLLNVALRVFPVWVDPNLIIVIQLRWQHNKAPSYSALGKIKRYKYLDACFIMMMVVPQKY